MLRSYECGQGSCYEFSCSGTAQVVPPSDAGHDGLSRSAVTIVSTPRQFCDADLPEISTDILLANLPGCDAVPMSGQNDDLTDMRPGACASWSLSHDQRLAVPVSIPAPQDQYVFAANSSAQRNAAEASMFAMWPAPLECGSWQAPDTQSWAMPPLWQLGQSHHDPAMYSLSRRNDQQDQAFPRRIGLLAQGSALAPNYQDSVPSTAWQGAQVRSAPDTSIVDSVYKSEASACPVTALSQKLTGNGNMSGRWRELAPYIADDGSLTDRGAWLARMGRRRWEHFFGVPRRHLFLMLLSWMKLSSGERARQAEFFRAHGLPKPSSYYLGSQNRLTARGIVAGYSYLGKFFSPSFSLHVIMYMVKRIFLGRQYSAMGLFFDYGAHPLRGCLWSLQKSSMLGAVPMDLPEFRCGSSIRRRVGIGLDGLLSATGYTAVYVIDVETQASGRVIYIGNEFLLRDKGWRLLQATQEQKSEIAEIAAELSRFLNAQRHDPYFLLSVEAVRRAFMYPPLYFMQPVLAQIVAAIGSAEASATG